MPAESAGLLDRDACPKHMEYGPCGGVEFDGSCEVADFRCVFLEMPTVRWHGVVADAAGPGEAAPASPAPDPLPAVAPSVGAVAMRELLATRQIVVGDLPAKALSACSIVEVAEVLRGRVDAVLAGDSGTARVQFPPAYRAHLLHDAGLAVWSGLNNRDRNRVALEGELAALAHAGASGVHCVTGDHTGVGSRPDAAPVFDLDSTETASLARRSGHLVSVGESPATPPVERRAERLLEKQRAGAEICFVNHAGGADPVRRFIETSRDLGVELGFIPCIPVVVDRESAELLGTFTTLVLPPRFLERILEADDPFEAGVAAAVELGEQLLALDGVVGVNLSGGTSPGRELAFAEALGQIGDQLAATTGRAA